MSVTVQHIQSFAEKLDAIHPSSLYLEPYPAQYLQLLLDNRLYYLHIYSQVLNLLLNNIDKKKEEIVLVDYGAGNGLLGIFAKYVGFKTVYLNDVSEAFLNAAEAVSATLQIEVDGFIKGDCDQVFEFSMQNEKPDAVVGTDVIEHIYRLDDFFRCLGKTNQQMVTVFTTASVVANPIKNYQLKKLQVQDEYRGSNAEHSSPHNEFAGWPFIEIRRKMLRDTFIRLSQNEIKQLAKATRGMNKDDIIKAGKRFEADRVLPKPMPHRTNTCDPVSGSWTERLLTVKQYSNIYNKAGFSLKVENGFYNSWQQGIKGSILTLVNKTIALLGQQGKVISPFITLVGKPVKTTIKSSL